ncbi:hypothetical protein JR316_0000892 [Psilocybe cubensis]|uniref:Uncharacterized protein n=1 Tax=Psilocybe cubensis TaxID=181762 RepID=A0ACB8HGJ5_PSICU|nr:hypothetical protein JR316_0000892 [Psilocybe cubensis]KAH9486827.1 hypothetical protein JR316_0000892 [Psilocybe cubensis]
MYEWSFSAPKNSSILLESAYRDTAAPCYPADDPSPPSRPQQTTHQHHSLLLQVHELPRPNAQKMPAPSQIPSVPNGSTLSSLSNALDFPPCPNVLVTSLPNGTVSASSPQNPMAQAPVSRINVGRSKESQRRTVPRHTVSQPSAPPPIASRPLASRPLAPRPLAPPSLPQFKAPPPSSRSSKTGPFTAADPQYPNLVANFSHPDDILSTMGLNLSTRSNFLRASSLPGFLNGISTTTKQLLDVACDAVTAAARGNLLANDLHSSRFTSHSPARAAAFYHTEHRRRALCQWCIVGEAVET